MLSCLFPEISHGVSSLTYAQHQKKKFKVILGGYYTAFLRGAKISSLSVGAEYLIFMVDFLTSTTQFKAYETDFIIVNKLIFEARTF